jgi:nitroreductase
MISKALKDKILNQAFRTPSVHNVQPWLLQINDDHLIIYDDLERTLKIGDPELHDHEVTIGIFIEAIRLILSTEGFGIKEIEDLEFEEVFHKNKKIRKRFKIYFADGHTLDPLALQILHRKSYRGLFNKSTEEDKKFLKGSIESQNVSVLTSDDDLKKWSKIYDDCAIRINAKPSYEEELYSWMRMTNQHPQYCKDGLNRESLSLSPIEGWIAKFLLKPNVYQFLNQLGLSKIVMTEGPQIRSSTGLVFVFRGKGVSDLEAGRDFYRLWLEITRLGFNACPLSSLVDDMQSRALIEAEFKGQTPLNVLRVGKAPKEKIYTSPRLSNDENLVG